MTEFIIFNNDNKYKIKLDLNTTISEAKKIISEKLKLSNINEYNFFLEKYGFIDTNPSLLNSKLSSLKPDLTNSPPPYYIFSFNKNNLENSIHNYCSQKLILSNDNSEQNSISQVGIKIKEKNDILVCLSCAKYCHNIQIDCLGADDIITDKNFICQCQNEKYKTICKYIGFNLDKIISENEKKEFNAKVISLMNKKKEEYENIKKKKKMIELNQKILQRDFDFQETVDLLKIRVGCYKDEDMQKKIKDIIPARPPNSTSEQYVKILLKWFKKDFFSWCNKPKCPECKQNGDNIECINSDGKPNEEELKLLAYRTEIYSCKNCKKEVKFVRYHKTSKLLETKTGRCGEWSNLFGAILYTCGFKTRLINNFEDHVWNEFYNEEEKRWIHIDPCEEAYDTPLVYEQGWGRVMTFILGFSDDGLVEVTPRYIKDWKIVNERRSEKMVEKLKKILEEVNKQMEEGVSQEEMKKREERRKNEIESFENKIKNDLFGEERKDKEKINEEEKLGRQSGSLEWRKQRGEC